MGTNWPMMAMAFVLQKIQMGNTAFFRSILGAIKEAIYTLFLPSRSLSEHVRPPWLYVAFSPTRFKLFRAIMSHNGTELAQP